MNGIQSTLKKSDSIDGSCTIMCFCRLCHYALTLGRVISWGKKLKSDQLFSQQNQKLQYQIVITRIFEPLRPPSHMAVSRSYPRHLVKFRGKKQKKKSKIHPFLCLLPFCVFSLKDTTFFIHVILQHPHPVICPFLPDYLPGYLILPILKIQLH